jgi:nitrite reductase/ring-hydroxylating ferredoxin subunit
MAYDLDIRRGPVLSDGTALRDLIDFERREVAMRVLSDPEIHRLEQKRIFARSWIGVAHVAEIPNPGDYVQRHIGEDAVIVTRDRDGEVHILLNACSHRGMQICWADKGNQSSFKCPYHGWAFNSQGNLMGAPFEREMYDGWDKSQYGLRKARVGLHHGRIFGNFDDNAPPLDEWLGAATYYLDAPYRGEPDPEMEVCMPPRRFRVKANWKISSDNNSGDVYHSLTLHRSVMELGIPMPPERMILDAAIKATCETMGHGITAFPGNIMELDKPIDPALDDYIFNCMLFPATFGSGGSGTRRHAVPGGGRAIILAELGGLVPCGVNEFEIWSATMIEKGAPEEVKAKLRSPALLDLAGVDDMESWPSMQKVARGYIGQSQPMRYNAVQAGDTKPADWAGPGQIYTGISKDDNQWNFWRRWYDLMSADEA